MPRSAAVFLLLTCVLAASQPAQAGEEFTERVFPLPGHGAFTIWVPESWRDEMDQPKGDLRPTIFFLPAHGQSFRILITPIWPTVIDEADFNSERRIRDMAENFAGLVQEDAVEESIEIRAIDDVTGFYFSTTDASLAGRTPLPGEYRHRTHGLLAVGDLLCPVTVLSSDPDLPAHLFLAALGTAAHRDGN